MATHSSTLAWRIPWTESLAGYSLWGHKESDVTEVTTHARTHARTHAHTDRSRMVVAKELGDGGMGKLFNMHRALVLQDEEF